MAKEFNKFPRSLAPYFRKPTMVSQSTNGISISPRSTTHLRLRKEATLPKKDTPKPPSTPPSNPPSSARLSAQWVQSKPENVAPDSHFVGLLDKQAVKSGKMVLCRIGDRHLQGDEVTRVLWKAEMSTSTLAGQKYGGWDDILTGNIGPYTPDI